MTIEVNKDGDVLILALTGKLDTVTAPGLEKVIKEQTKDAARLELDFDKLVYLSSAGLRVLLAAHKAMANQNGQMVIRNVNEEIMEVFHITGFSSLLTIE